MNFSDLLIDITCSANTIIRKAASNHNLSSSQAFSLLSIPFDGIAMSKLSKRLGVDPSTLTRNMDNLYKLKLIDKKQSSFDRRIQLIILSNKGQKIVKSVEMQLENRFSSVFSLIDLDIQEHLYAGLEKFSWLIRCQIDDE